MNGLYIPTEYVNGLLDLPKNDFAAVMRALATYCANPDSYKDALPPAPVAMHDLLAELVAIQGI